MLNTYHNNPIQCGLKPFTDVFYSHFNVMFCSLFERRLTTGSGQTQFRRCTTLKVLM
uniref:Uncharacterized protein n=1 Tax=Anguilla anguilla TaxID=7936 RepID=A0A0E9P5I4_ANGAN